MEDYYFSILNKQCHCVFITMLTYLCVSKRVYHLIMILKGNSWFSRRDQLPASPCLHTYLGGDCLGFSCGVSSAATGSARLTQTSISAHSGTFSRWPEKKEGGAVTKVNKHGAK